jgi:hypothetical protein
MASPDAKKQRRQRYAALLDAAEIHERAAARHDAAATYFARLGQTEVAHEQRVLAYEQRRKALQARRRARAELGSS